MPLHESQSMFRSVKLNPDGTVQPANSNNASMAEATKKETAAKRKILVQQLNKSIFGPTIRVAHFKRKRYRAAGRDFMQQTMAITKQDVVNSIRKTNSIVSNWADDRLQELVQKCMVKHLHPRDVAVYKGEPPFSAGVIVLLSGSVAFYDKLSDAPLKTVSAPAVIGDSDTLCDAPAPHYIAATMHSDIAILVHHTLNEMVYQVMPKAELRVLAKELAPRRAEVVRRFFPQTVPLMKQCWVCCDLPNDKIEDLIRTLKPQTFFPGDAIVEQGTLTPYMYFLRRGEADILVDSADKPVSSLKPGVSFGEMSVLFNERRIANVVARTACDVWVMDQRYLEAVCDKKTRRAIVKRATRMRTKWLADQKDVPQNPLTTTIRTIPTLAHCSDATFKDLIKSAQPRVFPQTSVVASKSEIVDGIYIVVRGSARSQRYEKENTQVYNSGKYFGELAFISHRWPKSIVSVSMMEVWFISYHDLEKCLAKRGPEELERAMDMTNTLIYKYQRRYGNDSITFAPRHIEALRNRPPRLTVKPRVPYKAKARSLLVDTETMTAEKNYGVPLPIDKQHQRRIARINDPDVRRRSTWFVPPVAHEPPEEEEEDELWIDIDQDGFMSHNDHRDVILLGNRAELMQHDPDFSSPLSGPHQDLLHQWGHTPTHKHDSVLARIRKANTNATPKKPLGAEEKGTDSASKKSNSFEKKSSKRSQPSSGMHSRNGSLMELYDVGGGGRSLSQTGEEAVSDEEMEESEEGVTPQPFVPQQPHSYAPVLPYSVQPVQTDPANKPRPPPKITRCIPTEAEADEIMDHLFTHTSMNVQRINDGSDDEDFDEERDYLEEAWVDMHKEVWRPRPPAAAVVANSRRGTMNRLEASMSFAPLRASRRRRTSFNSGRQSSAANSNGSDSDDSNANDRSDADLNMEQSLNRGSKVSVQTSNEAAEQKKKKKNKKAAGVKANKSAADGKRSESRSSMHSEGPRARPLTKAEAIAHSLPKPPHLPLLHKKDFYQPTAPTPRQPKQAEDDDVQSNASTPRAAKPNTARHVYVAKLESIVAPPIVTPQKRAGTPRGQSTSKQQQHDPSPTNSALKRYLAERNLPMATRVVKVPNSTSLIVANTNASSQRRKRSKKTTPSGSGRATPREETKEMKEDDGVERAADGQSTPPTAAPLEEEEEKPPTSTKVTREQDDNGTDRRSSNDDGSDPPQPAAAAGAGAAAADAVSSQKDDEPTPQKEAMTQE